MARRIRSTKLVGVPRQAILPTPPVAPLEEEPMHRYIHNIPTSLPNGTAIPSGAVNHSYIEESLARQNQLLLDILSAINGLTAATLKGRTLD